MSSIGMCFSNRTPGILFPSNGVFACIRVFQVAPSWPKSSEVVSRRVGVETAFRPLSILQFHMIHICIFFQLYIKYFFT